MSIPNNSENHALPSTAKIRENLFFRDIFVLLDQEATQLNWVWGCLIKGLVQWNDCNPLYVNTIKKVKETKNEIKM